MSTHPRHADPLGDPSEAGGRLLAVSPTEVFSGAEKVLVRVLGAAAERGWSAACACPDGPLRSQLDHLGAAWIDLPELKLPGGLPPAAAGLLASRNLRAAQVLRRACRDTDVVVANSLLTLPALVLARPHVPVVLLAHDVIRRPSWRWLLRRCRRVLTLVVAVSESAAEPFEAEGLPVKVVRNGTPWPVDPVPDEPRCPTVIGCAAVLSPWKGQDVLLEAVARLARRDIRVELAGGPLPKDRAFAEALQERVRRLDLAGVARLLGPVTDPLEKMRTWTAVVVPSVDPEAGGPLAALEAMSIGVPVIGTDIGATSEVVGEAGLLVAPRDPGALASAIERLVADREFWRRCHYAGPRQIAAGLTLDRQLACFLDVLTEVVNRDRSSSSRISGIFGHSRG